MVPVSIGVTADTHRPDDCSLGESATPKRRSWWPNSGHAAVAAIAALLLLRLVLIPVAVLIPEEAYYWMYSQYPALGYLDHPPMVAWLIAAGTAIFGATELGVRFGTWLLAVGATWLCYRLVADWSGRRAGITAALVFSITPLFFGTGFVTTPDAPLLFFWLLALLAVTRAYRRDSLGWWLLSGLAAGLGFLSKYPAMFLVPGTFVFLVSDSRGRRMLARPGPWLALCVAAVVASPVIWWNAQHEWASFVFQFGRRIAGHGGFKPGKTLEWVGVQFLLLSPLVFVLFTVAWWTALRRFRRDSTGRWRFAACFAVPWLAVCVWHGMFSGVKINWPLPAYLSLLVVAPALMRVSRLSGAARLSWLERRIPARKYARAMVLVNAVVLSYVALGASLPRPSLLAPWDKIGSAAETAEEEFHARTDEDPFIIADGRYKLASELAFYMRDPGDDDWNDVVPVSAALGGGLSYYYWRDARELAGRNAICVLEELEPRKLAALEASFERVEASRELITHPRGIGGTRRYWVILCHSFRGVPKSILRQ